MLLGHRAQGIEVRDVTDLILRMVGNQELGACSEGAGLSIHSC